MASNLVKPVRSAGVGRRPRTAAVIVGFALAASFAAAVLAMGGCGGRGDLLGARAQAEAVASTLRVREAELESAVRAVGPLAAAGDPRAIQAEAELGAGLSRIREQRRAAERAIADSGRLLAGGSAGAHPGGGFSDGYGAGDWRSAASDAASWLPDPVRVPALVGIGLAAGLARAAQLKRSARSIAAGLAEAVRGDDAMREALQRNADVIRRAQTKTAQKIVERELAATQAEGVMAVGAVGAAPAAKPGPAIPV